MAARAAALALYALALAPPALAQSTRECVVEAGRDLSARDISIQCGASEAEVARILDGQAELRAGQEEMKDLLLQLMQQSADYARMRAGGVTEANLIALASKVAEDVADPGQAFAQLSRFVEIAIAQQARARDNPSTDAFVAAVQERVAALSSAGDLSGASAEADRALSLWEAEQENQRLRGISLLETARDQDILSGEIARAAERSVQLYELESGREAKPQDIDQLAREIWAQVLQRGARSDLELTVALWRLAVARAEDPLMAAGLQNNLASALARQGMRMAGEEGADLLAQSAEALEAALAFRTREDHPTAWGATQHNLAGVLHLQAVRLAGTRGTDLLEQAVAAYGEALEVRTRADAPLDWAMTQNNLGNALQELGTRLDGAPGAARLGQSVSAFRQALDIRTEAEHPAAWASTQYNLGIALTEQAKRTVDQDEAQNLLGQAISALRATLSVRTRDARPVQWAQTQNKLSEALWSLGGRTPGPAGAFLLDQSLEAAEQALAIRTRADLPVQWGLTQKTKAEALLARASHDSAVDPEADLIAALAAIDAALDVFDPVNMSFNHGVALDLRQRVETKLAGQ